MGSLFLVPYVSVAVQSPLLLPDSNLYVRVPVDGCELTSRTPHVGHPLQQPRVHAVVCSDGLLEEELLVLEFVDHRFQVVVGFR